MAKLAFCDYYNMVAILEKTEHNTNFHQIVDFLEASHIRRITKGTKRISQSKVPSPRVDETAFLTGDIRYTEAFLIDTSLEAGQDRENIAKTSSMPHEALPRVTSLGGGEGEEERRICLGGCSKHGGMDQGEDLLDRDKSADKGSDSTDEMSHVLSTLGAANILANGGLRLVFTTASLSVATASTGQKKRKMIEPEQPSKEKVLEQLSVQLARDLEAKFTQEDQIIREQAKKDSKIARIHAEKELEMMIVELDRSNEMVAKYLSEYEQAEAGLSHDEKVKLINELLMYQRHLAQIKKYQAQQNKLATKTERRNFYMSILRGNAGWKDKDFKGMTFEQIEEKFIPVWEKMQDFVPMDSKLESERLKRPGIQLDKERIKKLKTAKASGTKPTQEQQSEEPKELSEEELKKMMELVPVEELYIESLQVKYPIIDWEIYPDGQRKYWKIIRVGNHTEVYQIFKDMLKKFNREDLDKLCSLVKETYSTTEVTDEKAKKLWVKLKRLYEPDSRDPLWALQRYMYDPLVWRLYDICGVHHVSTGRGHQIFMLVEKDYPLTKGLTTLMLSNKLQVDQYLEMAN
nr:hypothetical protein [Tanacetum cinerariifolium]